MAITTTSLLPAPVQQSFANKLLSVPVPNLIHNLGAMRKQMPRNGGTTFRMRRYNPLPTALVPLGNSGITPPATVASAVDIDAKMSFYGQYLIINEQVTLQDQDPVLNELTARLGVSLRETEDELTRNMLAATAGFINCTGGVNGDNPTEITRSDVDDVITALMDANAYTILDMIEGEDKFGTAPTRDAYFALCSTKLIRNLDNVVGFIPKAQYPAQSGILRSEYGSISQLRFLVSSIGSVTPNASMNGANVFNIFVTGLESYAMVEQDGYKDTFIYLPPQFSGPLAMNASIGWKTAMCPRICNDQWILNLRTTLA